MAPLANRILFRLMRTAPRSLESLHEALSVSRRAKGPFDSQPSIDELQAELERLEGRWVARVEDGWVLTEAGEREYFRLDDLFDNSGGYGDYGA